MTVGFQGKCPLGLLRRGTGSVANPARPSAGDDHWRIKPLATAAFSGDATRLAAGDDAGHVRLYDSAGRLLHEWPADRIGISALAWSPNNRLVAVGTIDGSVKLWDAADGTSLHRWPAFPLKVSSILFGPDGHWLLAGPPQTALKIWDFVTGNQLLTGIDPSQGWSADGRTIAMGDARRVGFCDLVFPQTLRLLTGHLSTGRADGLVARQPALGDVSTIGSRCTSGTSCEACRSTSFVPPGRLLRHECRCGPQRRRPTWWPMPAVARKDHTH